MSKFQIITLSVFVIFILVGVVVFATFKGTNTSSTQLPAITVWGTFPQDVFDANLGKISLDQTNRLDVTYVQKNKSTFSQEFIAALARGTGPDAIIVTADMLLPHLDKITPVPYTAFPQRDFMNAYVQEGEIYLGSNGIYALPFVIDPLVMYWNRDILSSAGLALPPKTWDEFSNLNKKVTTKDQNGNIRKSAIAMGDFGNVVNAREILASLFLQSGNPITKTSGNYMQSALKLDPSITPALQFFTKFVDPNNADYSWNRGMQDSKTAFLTGTLATYFGFASELKDIRAKNPNLNFDVSALPQMKSGGVKAVYGKMYGISIVRSSTKQNAVYQIFSIINNAKYEKALSDSMYLPSIRRDVISAGSSDPYISVFNDQALITKTWLDADPTSSFNIFGNMINAVTSGAKTVRDAIMDASDQYDVVLKQAAQ